MKKRRTVTSAASVMWVMLALGGIAYPQRSQANQDTKADHPESAHVSSRVQLPEKEKQESTKEPAQCQKVVRDAYVRLMRYHTAARDEQAAASGVSYKPDDYVVFELRDIHTGSIDEITNRPLAQLVTSTPDEVLNVTGHHLQYGNGPMHSSYDMAWSSRPTSAAHDDKLTVSQFLVSGGDPLSDIVRYTSYEVTIRLAGKERIYRAIALLHSGADSNGKIRTEILDNVTAGMNEVLADESPRVRSPWKTYVKSGLYLAVATDISKKQKAGKPLIPADAPIGYLPGDDVAPADKQAMQLAAGCVEPISTDDVVVVGWVDGEAIELPSGADPILVGLLNTTEGCLGLVGAWALGSHVRLDSDLNKAYANAFLLKNSANARPPETILPSAIQSGGDYRLFNRFKVRFSVTNGTITNLSYLQSASVIGSTPNPCGSVLPSTAADAHPSNGANGVTASNSVYLLSEGSLGSTGRDVNQTINGRTTPWIWSVIKFNSLGDLNATDNSALFPTFHVYKNFILIQIFRQNLNKFIKQDESWQRQPSEIQ